MPEVEGLDRFRDHFEDFKDHYVLIGGTASSMAMDSLDIRFRTTKDLDVVLIVEELNKEFAEALWEFIALAKYEIQQKGSKPVFYRFKNAKTDGYPFMLELFSQAPDKLEISDGSHLTPIPTDEDISSLSAILMDDDYYDLILRNRVLDQGISRVNEQVLVPLKTKAFVDLTEKRNAGMEIQSKDIRKHKNDVFRLYQILPPEETFECPESIKQDLKEGFDMFEDEHVSLSDLHIKGSKGEILSNLRRIYGIE